MGVAIIGIGTALGFPSAMSAGAVVSGAYFGDKMSPLSDTTNLAPAVAGSNLFDHINIDQENCNIPSGLTEDPESECAAYDELIAELKTDLQLLGMGPNGHIGFNEPDEVFIPGTHCVKLAESTIDANQRFFATRDDVPRYAYTMGIWGIMQAKKVLMVVNGKNKAAAVKAALTGPVDPKVPASILQLHPDCTIVADEEALSLLAE